MLAGAKCFSEICVEVRRGDDPHLSDAAVDELLGDGELVEHAERDGAAAGFGSGWTALQEVGFDAACGEGFRSAGSRRAAADDSGAEGAAVGAGVDYGEER